MSATGMLQHPSAWLENETLLAKCIRRDPACTCPHFEFSNCTSNRRISMVQWPHSAGLSPRIHDIGKLLRNWRHSDGVLEDLGQIGFLPAVCWRIVATPQT